MAVDEDITLSAIAWSPDGTQFAIASASALWITNARTNQAHLLNIADSDMPLSELRWSPGDKYLAAISDGIYVWEASSSQIPVSLSGTTSADRLLALTWLSETELRVIGSDNTISTWQLL